MTDDFGTPITPEEEGGRNTTLIIIIVVAVVLLCCCCASVGLFWTYGDMIIQELGLQVKHLTFL